MRREFEVGVTRWWSNTMIRLGFSLDLRGPMLTLDLLFWEVSIGWEIKPSEEDLEWARQVAAEYEVYDMMKRFPPGVVLTFNHVVADAYRVGYQYRGITYKPGFGSIYPLEEAVRRCLDQFTENEELGIHGNGG